MFLKIYLNFHAYQTGKSFCILIFNFPHLNIKTTQTNLQRAVIQRNKKEFDKYLMSQACLNDSTGSTALMYACQNGFSYKFDELCKLEQGKQNIHGYTALMYAAEYGNVEFISSLIKKEGGLKNNQQQTAYQLANNNETAKFIEQLCYNLQPGAELNMESGGTILHYLASNTLLTEQMIEQYKNYLKKQDFNGQTALIRAVINKNVQNVFLLLKYEAGIRDFNNLTSFDYQYDIDTNIAQQIEYEVATQLFKIATDKNCTYNDIKQYDSQKFQQNIESGRTALMMSADTGNIEACKWLIDEAGMQSTRGFTALMYAAAESHREIINLLVEAEKALKDCDGSCALHYFLQYQNVQNIPQNLMKYEIGILNNVNEGVFHILLQRGLIKEILPKDQMFWNLILQREITQVGINPLIKHLTNKNYQLQLEEKDYDANMLINLITPLMIILNQTFKQQQICDLVKHKNVLSFKKQYILLFIALFIISQNPYENANIVVLLIKLFKYKLFSTNDKISFTFIQNCIITEKKQISDTQITQQLKSINNQHNYLIERCYKKNPFSINNIIKNDLIHNCIEIKQTILRQMESFWQTEWCYQCDLESG